ncbi:transposable element Tc1 transposase [Trichonephila clavipes]|nr:transposable element Tc1 transposase [Trichonephila clavipes]
MCSTLNCVLTIIEDVSGDAQDIVLILLSLLHATHALNQELSSGALFLITAGPLWSSLETTYSTEVRQRHSENCLLSFLLQNPGLFFLLDNSEPHTACVAIKCLPACKTLPWLARCLSNQACLDMMGRHLHLPWNVDDIARQLEQISEEISQETIRVLYHSMRCRVAACTQARGGSTPY